ncbi:MAG: DUF2165 domain-containing protein [Mangrovicoccus sp.]|nr:DUF2165 domain-containing protein [Mangrovicoccus sp.]
MYEFAVILSQLGLLLSLGAWMFTGARDNWLFPFMNQNAIAMVVRMDGLQEAFPEDYACIAHRRITDPARIKQLYWAIVIWESFATLLLAVASIAMALALLGLMDHEAARGLGLLGALAFMVNWAGFTIGGNHFGYWYLHAPTQATHFLLALWGTGTMIMMTIPQ